MMGMLDKRIIAEFAMRVARIAATGGHPADAVHGLYVPKGLTNGRLP
jgi:hypothetical protein